MDVIVELRAGAMRLADGRLSADPRKGLIRVTQDEAGLAHFCWHERDGAMGEPVGAEPEVDIVVIPGECTFTKIQRPGSRVFQLRFEEEQERNMFFWAQEVDSASDEDYVAAINLALSPEAEEEQAQQGGAAPQAMDADVSPAVPAAPAAAASGAAGAIGAADLAAILGSIMSGGAAGGGGGSSAGLGALLGRQRGAMDPGPTLGDVLRPDALEPLLRQPGMVERLSPFLPEEHRNAESIVRVVRSPQFRHQLDLLSHALMTGQLDTRQFGLPPGGFGVADFLRGIQAQADSERAQQGQQAQQGGDGGGAPGQ